MIRCRFTVVGQEDYRPVNWPIKHPYWCTGYSEEGAIVVAYADDEAEIRRNWPEAANLDSTEASDYVFTSRFPCPDWFTAADQPSVVLTNPWTGEPRDIRDVESDPAGLLMVEPGKPLLAAVQPPAAMSAEEHCRMFCAWKGGGPCLADDCPRRTKDQPEDAA